MTLQVAVPLVADGYASVATIICDTFRSVGVLWDSFAGDEPTPRFNVRTASATGAAVSTFGNIGLTPDTRLADLPPMDLVIVPDTGADLDEMLALHADLIAWLRRQHAGGAKIAAACSGVAFLAEAGLLDGRLATTHWALQEQFAARWPAVRWRTDVLVTEDQGIYCGGGVYACMDLSLYLIEKLCGRDVALKTARALLLDMPRTHQSSYSVLPHTRPHADEAIRKVEELLQGRYRDEVRIEALAEQVGMSGRTLERRFRAATGHLPRAYIQKLRIAEARRRLEDGAESIQTVCSAVGYDDLQFFRGLFKRHTGLTPQAYRRRFGAPPASTLGSRA